MCLVVVVVVVAVVVFLYPSVLGFDLQVHSHLWWFYIFAMRSSFSTNACCKTSKKIVLTIRGKENFGNADGKRTNTLILPPQRQRSGAAENFKNSSQVLSRARFTPAEIRNIRARGGNRFRPGVIPAIGSKRTAGLDFSFIYLFILRFFFFLLFPKTFI